MITDLLYKNGLYTVNEIMPSPLKTAAGKALAQSTIKANLSAFIVLRRVPPRQKQAAPQIRPGATCFYAFILICRFPLFPKRKRDHR